MLTGWTKRWRKRWEKGYHKDLLMWVMMDYFIDFAAFEPTDRYIPGAGVVHLERGEFAFSERELSVFFGVDRQRIRTCLKKLKSKPFINPLPNPKYTLIKIINYDTYQSEDCFTNPKLTHCLTSNKPTPNPNRVSTISKELKNKRIISYPQDFETFWSEYPKKHKKHDAFVEWKKIDTSNGTFEKIMSGLCRWKESSQWNDDGGKYIPDPERFIKKRRWEDEVKINVQNIHKAPTWDD